MTCVCHITNEIRHRPWRRSDQLGPGACDGKERLPSNMSDVEPLLVRLSHRRLVHWDYGQIDRASRYRVTRALIKRMNVDCHRCEYISQRANKICAARFGQLDASATMRRQIETTRRCCGERPGGLRRSHRLRIAQSAPVQQGRMAYRRPAKPGLARFANNA